MKFKFNYKGKQVEMNVKFCDNVFLKASGLMFRRKSEPLLFVFNKKGRRAIHSFFCKPFYAIWFNESKIIDEKLINKWVLNIKPKEKFDKLLEVPSNYREFYNFIDGKRN